MPINKHNSPIFLKMMNNQQLDQLKLNYAEMIVEGMDMDTLITFAIESIEQNIKDWSEDDIKSEIIDYYGDETLEGLMENVECDETVGVVSTIA